MGLSMASGLLSSFALETVYLQLRDGLSPGTAAKAALTMSATSMLAMEAAETLTDLHLTQGVVAPGEMWWWSALGVSLAAGYAAPLPYNYYMLRKHGRACCAKPPQQG
jgi:hypothetical protein